MKKFFGKIKNWFKRHKPSKRRLIQVYAALLYNANIKGFVSGNIYRGNVKQVCVPGLNCYSCPGASGACPLGALQNALAHSGTTAPYYVLGIILLMGLILGRTICGFLCPVGLGQELLYKIKTPKLKKSRYTRIASYLKYVILAVLVVAIPLSFGLGDAHAGVPAFCKYICPAGTFGGAIGHLFTPAAGSTLAEFGSLFTWKFAVLCVMMVACVFIYRFFCRFFCPLGALYGLFSRIALLGVKLDKNKCTDCGLCLNVCKMDIKRVGDHECIQCGECISACPAKAISWKGSKLFVHQNAVDAGAPVEEKPLGALLSANTAEVSKPVVTEEIVVAEETAVAAGETPEAVAVRKTKKRNFWLQFAAWAAAIALLIGALVYYNFIDKGDAQTGNKVGDRCSDFTVQLYDGENTQFTLSQFVEDNDKVLIINFWATWCGPCVEELPDFEELQKNYADDVLVLAISEDKTADVQAYLNEVGWNEYAIQFAQDTFGGNIGDVYSLLTDKSGYPVTLVLDRDGTITYNKAGKIHKDKDKIYETLENLIKPLIEQE